MRTYERDYRYLLLHLVPQHRLSTQMRRDVGAALRSGNTDALRRESLRALEELCDNDYFERTGVESSGGDVLVAYRRRGGRYRVSVAVPEGEFSAVSGIASPRNGGPEPREGAAAMDPPAAAPVAKTDVSARDAVGYLPDIIRTFAITDRTDPILSRLETLLETLEGWFDLNAVALHVIEGAAGGEGAGERVHVAPEEEMRRSDLLRMAIETGAQRLVPKAELEGESGTVDWGVLGVAPIFASGKVYGVLQAYFPPGIDSETMASRLKVTSGVIRQVIDFHVEVANLTSIDALTQLYNRQFYEAQLSVEIERAKRSGTALTMLMVDIDDFKRINDEMGHKKGDEALGAVAELIRRNLRKIDLPFRYGGEEFVVLLPGAGESESVHTAERLRRVVAEYRGFNDLHGRPRSITVSVGGAVYPEEARTVEELFLHADAAMYAAKEAGKDRVVFYREGMDLDRSRLT
jgi:diguanylate cyclase (GGDEF)-like protein